MAAGMPVARAWPSLSSTCLRTGYRIRRALIRAGPNLRTYLLSRAPPPALEIASPVAQLVTHLRAVLGNDDPLGAFQVVSQKPLFA